MPIPKPTPKETEKEFIQRCMIDSVMIIEYRNKDQRYAVCKQSYNERD